MSSLNFSFLFHKFFFVFKMSFFFFLGKLLDLYFGCKVERVLHMILILVLEHWFVTLISVVNGNYKLRVVMLLI